MQIVTDLEELVASVVELLPLFHLCFFYRYFFLTFSSREKLKTLKEDACGRGLAVRMLQQWDYIEPFLCGLHGSYSTWHTGSWKEGGKCIWDGGGRAFTLLWLGEPPWACRYGKILTKSMQTKGYLFFQLQAELILGRILGWVLLSLRHSENV